MTDATEKLWISSDSNGGYDIGTGDITIARVFAKRDIPRNACPAEYDPRCLALLFKMAPELLAAAESLTSSMETPRSRKAMQAYSELQAVINKARGLGA
jgi:hypothetical protein